jgi:NADH-quinone oxidoreductase subunit L
MGLVAVFFTGFYTFRMVFLTFHGEPRTDVARDPHEVRWNVKGPLVVLGVLAATAGLVNMVPVQELTGVHLEFLHDWLDSGDVTALTAHHYADLLHDYAGYSSAELASYVAGLVSLALALAGAGVAHVLYNVPEPDEHTEKLGAIKTLWYNNYYQDEYQVWLAQSVVAPLARLADMFDQGVVDGVVDGVSSVSLFAGSRIRRLQTGVVSNYAALLTLGLTALLVAFGILGGWFA